MAESSGPFLTYCFYVHRVLPFIPATERDSLFWEPSSNYPIYETLTPISKEWADFHPPFIILRNMGSITSNSSVPSLIRALRILEMLSTSEQGMSVAEICRQAKIPRNSGYRICNELLDCGYLKYRNGTPNIVLTRKMFAIGYRALGNHNLIEVARPFLTQLRDEVKETVLLGSLLETSGAVLDEVPGTHHFNYRIERGAKFYLHSAAAGKALLAFLPTAEQASIVDSLDFIPFNSNTIISVNELLEELEQVKKTKIAYDRAEQIEGCHCVAAPILDQFGYPVAAVWTTGPSARLHLSDLPTVGNIVLQTALKISQQLGYLTNHET